MAKSTWCYSLGPMTQTYQGSIFSQHSNAQASRCLFEGTPTRCQTPAITHHLHCAVLSLDSCWPPFRFFMVVSPVLSCPVLSCLSSIAPEICCYHHVQQHHLCHHLDVQQCSVGTCMHAVDRAVRCERHGTLTTTTTTHPSSASHTSLFSWIMTGQPGRPIKTKSRCDAAGQVRDLEAAPGGSRIAACTAAGALEIWQGESQFPQTAEFELQVRLADVCHPEASCCAWLPGLKPQLLLADSARWAAVNAVVPCSWHGFAISRPWCHMLCNQHGSSNQARRSHACGIFCISTGIQSASHVTACNTASCSRTS